MERRAMKYMVRQIRKLLSILLGCLVLVGSVVSQSRPTYVSPIELIANPDKFDKKAISVQGYLLFFHDKGHVSATFLYVHQEDARNLLPNDLVVVASEQMLRDEEKIDRKYVTLTGTFHMVQTAGNDVNATGVIKDIRSCAVWSDPDRPIGEKGETKRSGSN
jgi:hypothetical protein